MKIKCNKLLNQNNTIKLHKSNSMFEYLRILINQKEINKYRYSIYN